MKRLLLIALTLTCAVQAEPPTGDKFAWSDEFDGKSLAGAAAVMGF